MSKAFGRWLNELKSDPGRCFFNIRRIWRDIFTEVLPQLPYIEHSRLRSSLQQVCVYLWTIKYLHLPPRPSSSLKPLRPRPNLNHDRTAIKPIQTAPHRALTMRPWRWQETQMRKSRKITVFTLLTLSLSHIRTHTHTGTHARTAERPVLRSQPGQARVNGLN